MIVTVVVVLAIVGSAFAFKVKGGARFCVLDINAGGTTCTTYTDCNMKTTTLGNPATAWKYYPFFDGNLVTCTTTNNGLCFETTRLTID